MRGFFKNAVCLILFSLILLIIPAKALAAANSSSQQLDKLTVESTNNNVEIFPEKDNVLVNKSWKIVFTVPVDRATIKNYIKVNKKDTNETAITNLTFDNDDKTVYVNIVNGYNPKETYTLTIDSNAVSRDGKKINKEVVMDFTTDLKVASIQDTTASVPQYDNNFNFPSEVTAVMTDGTLRKEKVAWNSNIDTSKTGTFNVSGTVEGCPVKANLKLTVTALANESRTQSQLQVNLYKLALDSSSREAIESRAIQLHDGNTSNNCVFTAAEALRRAGMTDLPLTVCNTGKLFNETSWMMPYSFSYQLQQRGWQIERSYSNLLPGDICFTRDYGDGRPTHTYIFMKWAKPNDYSYAYVFDNQRDADGSLYHLRNVDFQTDTKDITMYFMHS